MTTLIKNILLIDGSGQPAVKADVLIKNEKIAAIGSFPRYQADTVIDGVGAYLAPGFIDINTHSDRYLTIFSNPGQRHFLLQGITTIIGGQDGVSLAPLLYGSLDLQAYWTDPYQINVDWHTVEELFDVLRRRAIGVNFGTFVGHSTIRHAIMGNDFRDPTIKELGVVHYMIDKAMQDGAFGVSFDLQSAIAALTPGKEIKSILEIVERYKGLGMFKIRSGSDTSTVVRDASERFLPSVNEIVTFSKETGTRTQISNFSPLKGLEPEYRQAIDLIEENATVADVYFNIHPFTRSVIPVVSFLPLWAQRGGMDEIARNFDIPDLIVKIAEDMPKFDARQLVIYDAPGFEYLIGKSLHDFGEDRGTNMPETLLTLMRMTKLRATLLDDNLSIDEMGMALACDRSVLASSGASFPDDRKQASRVHLFDGAVPTFLEIVAKDKAITVEMAVRKITSIPAQRLGIKNRGMIREGYFADLVMFRDTAVEAVFVNGVVAVRDGVLTESLNGRILRHAHE